MVCDLAKFPLCKFHAFLNEIHLKNELLMDRILCIFNMILEIFRSGNLDNSSSGSASGHNGNATVSDGNNKVDQKDDTSNDAKDSQCHFSTIVVVLASFHESKGTNHHEKNSTHEINE